MLEKWSLEPGGGTCEPYLSKLRDVNIRFEGNSRSSATREVEESPKKETFSESSRILASHLPKPSSRKEILQSFAQYRDQMHHDFHYLKSDIQKETQKTCLPSISPEEKEKGFSCYSTEFAFEIPHTPQEKEPDNIPARPLPTTPSISSMEAMHTELEKFLENPHLATTVEKVMEKEAEPASSRLEQESPRLPENPFAQLLVEKKEAREVLLPESSSMKTWQQKLNCFAMIGIACGTVILGMACYHGNTNASVWNLGFSFGIAGITSLLTSGILTPIQKISRLA